MIKSTMHRILNKIANSYTLQKNKVMTGEQLLLIGKLSVYNGGKMTIGDNVKIISAFEENVVGGYPKTKLYTCRGGRL